MCVCVCVCVCVLPMIDAVEAIEAAGVLPRNSTKKKRKKKRDMPQVHALELVQGVT